MSTNLRKNSGIPQKRRLATRDECMHDLKYELIAMFSAQEKAKKAFNDEVVLSKPGTRGRGFEASLYNTKMIGAFQEAFPTGWVWGKYKRFNIHVNGYIVLLKKLDSKDLPMNIRTGTVENISQQLTFSFFEEDVDALKPILFFGYQRDKFGNYLEPKLVYVDNGLVRWSIKESDLYATSALREEVKLVDETPAMPKLKRSSKKKAQ